MSLSRKQFLKFLGFGGLAAGTFGPGRLAGAVGAGASTAGSSKHKIKDIEIYAFDAPLCRPVPHLHWRGPAATYVLVRSARTAASSGSAKPAPFRRSRANPGDQHRGGQGDPGHAHRQGPAGRRRHPSADRTHRPLQPERRRRLRHGPATTSSGSPPGCRSTVCSAATRPHSRRDITTGTTPEAMAANAKGHVDRGYKTLKVKVGLDPDQDLARLGAVREAIGEAITLRIDANQG